MWDDNNVYEVRPTKQFKRQYKNMMKQNHYDIAEIDEVINTLASGENLGEEYYPHKLRGKLSKYWGCHIRNDWVMVYYRDDNELVLSLISTGSHQVGY